MKDIKIVKSITNRDCDSLSLFFKDIYKYSPLSPEEEKQLAREHTKESLNKLVTHNLKFVVTVAKQYQGQGLPLEDLISFGSIGMMKAAEKFNPDRGFKFISYAVWWIRQSIIEAIYLKSKVVRTTTTHITEYNKLTKTTAKFIEDNDRPPSDDELSELTNIPAKRINEILSKYNTFLSLDEPISEESSTYVDVIENENASRPDLDYNKKSNIEILHKIVNKLPLRERTIIIEHLGLKEGFGKSFDEVGKLLNLTGERTRQIYNLAIKKLRDRYGDILKQLI